MNRTRMVVGLLTALFVSAVGIGVAMGWNERPVRSVAAISEVSVTTTTVARPTTTAPRARATTTIPSTTVPSTTTTRPRPTTSVTVPATLPPETTTPTEPPPTIPEPTTTTTVVLGYDPLYCAEVNRQYAVADVYGDPQRIVLLKQAGCPALYW